jgi:hypothetical protein
MVISIDAEKAFNKIEHPLMIKALMYVGKEGIYFNIIKAMHDKPIANIILNREKLKTFPIKSRMRQGWQVFIQQFNIVLEFLIRVIQQEEEIKGIQIGKEVRKHLFAENMILYMKDPKQSTKISYTP